MQDAITPHDLIEEAKFAIRDLLSKEFSERSGSSQFVHPLDERRVGYEAIKSAMQDLRPEARAFYAFVQHVYRGHTANPNDKVAVSKLTATYHRQDDFFSADELGHTLERALERSRHVAIVGPRGGGKTSFINDWLNRRTKDYLEEQLKVAWFRIDATKVYALKRLDDCGPDQAPTMANYFKIHAVYVFLQYSGEVDVKATIRRGDDERWTRSAQFLRVLNRIKVDNPKKFSEHVEAFRRYATATAAEAVRRTKEDRGTYDFSRRDSASELIVQNLFKRTNSEMFRRSIDLWGMLCRGFEGDDEKIGILAIIDGVDNLSWSAENAEYVRMCEDTMAFIRTFDDIIPTLTSKLLLASRPETIPELMARVNPPGLNPPPSPPIKFRLVDLPAPDFQAILATKQKAAFESDAFDVERSECKQTIEKIDNKRDDATTYQHAADDFGKFSASFASAIVERLHQTFLGVDEKPLKSLVQDITVETLLANVFDNNVRALVDALLAAKVGRRVAARIGVLGADNPSRILEYVLLGGALYCDSRASGAKRRYTDIARGEVFPNIFCFDTIDATPQATHWHGLAGLRILQLCSTRTLAAGDVILFLEEAFGYSFDVLAEHVEAFVAYGLLNVKYRENRGVVFAKGEGATGKMSADEEKYAKYNGYISTSEKGKLVAGLSFAHIGWLYHLALDTPLHQGEVDTTNKVKFYAEPIPRRNPREHYYFDALVPTVCTFMRHVNYYSDRERRRLQSPETSKSLSTKFNSLFKESGELVRAFELPKWIGSHINSQLDQIVDRRGSPGQPAGFSTLVNDLKGLI